MPQAARQIEAYPTPGSIREFRFETATLAPTGAVELAYALDDAVRFVEHIEVPVRAPITPGALEAARPVLDLLHWVAGVSYFKSAAPPRVTFSGTRPGPAAADLLAALYSEGLGEFALQNGIDLPRPAFPSAAVPRAGGAPEPGPKAGGLLVPVGGGKDSIVAIELLRATGRPLTLFSVGNAGPFARTADVAGLPWLSAARRIDTELLRYNEEGALNGHVPVTAIVSAVACLVATLGDHGAVVMANERSASAGSLRAYGIEVNHQFSKGLRVERLFRAALSEATSAVSYFSVLRGASELAITRAFSRLRQYHQAFTSCNAVFRLDDSRRAASWCGRCPKCRFVFLALAPFMTPTDLASIFGGRNLLADPSQYDGIAHLAGVGGHKPFECVGEEQEVVAAFRLLAEQPAWRDAPVVQRFVREVLPGLPTDVGAPDRVLEWSDDHEIPASLVVHAQAILGP